MPISTEKVVHDLADLLEDRVHRMRPLVAVLDAQNAGALVPQCGERLSVPVDAADLLDELEAGAIPNDEDAAKIKDTIAALGGVPGTEHLPHHEPEPREPTESHVNGPDEELVTDNAG